MVEVKLVTGAEEQEALFQFRYRIYVEEMGRTQHDADHEQKRIVDVLDDKASNLIAVDNGHIVGAVRVNFSSGCPIPFYSSFYRMGDQPGTTLTNACVVTRMMIAKEVRRQIMAVRLCVAAYELSLWRGTRYGFIDCNDHLVDFFEALGFRHYMGTALHKEYGEVHPLLLDLYDEPLLRRLNSPFLKPFLTWKLVSSSQSSHSPNGQDRAIAIE